MHGALLHLLFHHAFQAESVIYAPVLETLVGLHIGGVQVHIALLLV